MFANIVICTAIYISIGIIITIVTEVLIHDYSPAEWPPSDDVRLLAVLFWPLVVVVGILAIMGTLFNRIVQICVNALIETRDTLEREEERFEHEDPESRKTQIR